MRYLVGFVFVVAFGTLRLVGCGDEEPECHSMEDCDDQSPCTYDLCSEGVCEYFPFTSDRPHPYIDPPTFILPCELDEESSGFCVQGVCKENSCVSDDPCVSYEPFYSGGCRATRIHPDGTPCEANGAAGVCIFDPLKTFPVCSDDPCEGVLCEGEFCLDLNTRIIHYCDYRDGVCKEKYEGCLDRINCTSDTCDPETGDCLHTPVHNGSDCCDGISCEHHNSCMRSFCDPDTHACLHAPDDGRKCCLRYAEECDFFCWGYNCCRTYCASWGECGDGVCR